MQTRTTKRAGLTTAIAAALLITGAASAIAGGGFEEVLVTPTGDRDLPSFEFSEPGRDCDIAVGYRIWERTSPLADPGDLTIEDLVIEDLDVDITGEDPWEGTFIVDLPGGEYWFEIVCEDDIVAFSDHEEIEPGGFLGDLGFARLLLEVEVEGDVPDDTTFEVSVACDVEGSGIGLAANGDESDDATEFTVIREFDAAGGTQQVVLYRAAAHRLDLIRLSADFEPSIGDIPADCLVTQSEVEGAETTSNPAANSPVEISIDEAGDYTVTFTNVFPTEEEEEEEAVEVDDEAEPAEPVEAEPDFTG